MRVDKVTSGDGAVVTVYSTGAGPGIVILHGGGVGEWDYRRLANALADRFTVHLYNRRGRPDSAPLTGTETVETDLADLGAVLEHTGARSVFGHSGGGFVALRAGLTMPLERIAVYDPGLSIDGRPSGQYIPEFERLVSEGEYARAMTVMARATYPDDIGAKVPFGVAVGMTKLFLRTPIGRRFVDLMPTIPPEVRRIFEHDGPATDYAGITADLLLTAGARSPRYFMQNCQAVADVTARGRALCIPRASHNSANIARPEFVQPFAEFFAGSVTMA
ncbi:alpha/beta hydrolase [Dactylosporangium aurantiacum]|uniref:Alpha/beta hydrolase n=1 Tax=Dactylosporangium aurantiacum TaxID=35754 RepID=A0A9Q9ICR0_9ACTN|nr:alpha/beta hydrolase [Dactylosporangium aurantiacum]MDG6103505.1 alpha/beta hydrolase [Dactylosporangium aurantiacum]UWZ51995.1 alpha/beta hydrolase [Dactylosporangium aurantiacum]